MKKHLPTGTIGAASELIVASYLILKGYEVYRAMSQCSNSDLIAIRGDKILKIEVRSGWTQRNGVKIMFVKKAKDRCDIYGVYNRSDQKVYFFYRGGLESVSL